MVRLNQTAKLLCDVHEQTFRSGSSFRYRTFACACVCIYLVMCVFFFVALCTTLVFGLSFNLLFITICMVHILKQRINQPTIYLLLKLLLSSIVFFSISGGPCMPAPDLILSVAWLLIKIADIKCLTFKWDIWHVPCTAHTHCVRHSVWVNPFSLCLSFLIFFYSHWPHEAQVNRCEMVAIVFA